VVSGCLPDQQQEDAAGDQIRVLPTKHHCLVLRSVAWCLATLVSSAVRLSETPPRLPPALTYTLPTCAAVPHPSLPCTIPPARLKDSSEGTVRTLVDMEGSYLSANFFREIVAAESFAYNSNAPKPAFVTLTGGGGALIPVGMLVVVAPAWVVHRNDSPPPPPRTGQTRPC
jgi:hypothetical protein